jgi:riboflavin kinase / FMN adenylyltransferase
LVSRMLGRPYALFGPVVKGDGLGRQLGFPTANLNTAGLVLPPSGVYAAQSRIQGRLFASVLHIGTRPTLDHPARGLRTEVHVLDFHGDLYDTQLEVILGSRLRDERRFSGLPELQAQIARDAEAARKALRHTG